MKKYFLIHLWINTYWFLSNWVKLNLLHSVTSSSSKLNENDLINQFNHKFIYEPTIKIIDKP